MRRLAVALWLFGLGARAESEPEVAVVVRGQRDGASSRDPTAASTVVRGAALERPGADAADVLADVPGVQVTRTGSSADLSTASIRGATSAQTPVYLAGIRLNDDVTGTADLSLVPLWMLDRVEVFRGNAPAEADRLGIGGAIFLEPKLPRDSRVGAGAQIGSFGERAAWLGGAVGDRSAGALVALRTERADNDYEYVDDRGTAFDPGDDRTLRRRNADHESADAWAIGRWRLGPRGERLTLVMNALSREQGVTGLGVVPARRARARVRRQLAAASARLPLGDFGLELSSAWLEASSALSDPGSELALPAALVASAGQRFVQELRLQRELAPGWSGRIGLAQELERLAIDAPGAAGLRAGRQTTRATLSLKNQRGPLALHALGAAECHGTSGPEGAERCGTFEPTGRLGAALAVSAHATVLANLGRYVRVPTLGELYGISPAVRGNTELDVESGVTADLGLRLASGASPRLQAWLDGFVFARWVDDLVAYRRSGFGFVRPFNVGSARVLGAELSGVVDALGHVRSELAVTALDPRDTTDDRALVNDLIPYQSRLATSARVELYARSPLERVDRAGIGARARYRSSRVADSAGLIVLEEQAVFDLDATLLLLAERLALRASVENVADARHFDTLGLPLPGRSYHAAAEAWFR